MSCTHPSLYVRDAHDACIVLEAVRKGILPLWTKRLSPAERNSVRPGNIYVWEEADEKGGLERWTDGRRWTQSRMRLDFLFYEELTPLTEDDKEVKRQLRNSAEASNSTPPSRRRERMLRANGLAKQTISMLVNTGESKLKRWHLVAYTSLDDKRAPLPLIDQYENLRSIRVPEKVFFTTRGYSWDKKPVGENYGSSFSTSSHMNGDNMSITTPTSGSSPLSSHSRSTSQSLPSPPHPHGRRPSLPYRRSEQDTRLPVQGQAGSSQQRPFIAGAETQPLQMNGSASRRPAITRHDSIDHPPTRNTPLMSVRFHPNPHSRIDSEDESSSVGGSYSITTKEKLPTSGSGYNYVPLSPEDRRVLNSFNLRL